MMTNADGPAEDDLPQDDDQRSGDRPARGRGDRFKEGDDVLQQLEEIEEAQRKMRQRKARGMIDNIEKSQQRAKKKFRDMRTSSDVEKEEWE